MGGRVFIRNLNYDWLLDEIFLNCFWKSNDRNRSRVQKFMEMRGQFLPVKNSNTKQAGQRYILA